MWPCIIALLGHSVHFGLGFKYVVGQRCFCSGYPCNEAIHDIFLKLVIKI